MAHKKLTRTLSQSSESFVKLRQIPDRKIMYSKRYSLENKSHASTSVWVTPSSSNSILSSTKSIWISNSSLNLCTRSTSLLSYSVSDPRAKYRYREILRCSASHGIWAEMTNSALQVSITNSLRMHRGITWSQSACKSVSGRFSHDTPTKSRVT